MRMRQNGQTRMVQIHAGAIPWKFRFSHPLQ